MRFSGGRVDLFAANVSTFQKEKSIGPLALLQQHVVSLDDFIFHVIGQQLQSALWQLVEHFTFFQEFLARPCVMFGIVVHGGQSLRPTRGRR